MSRYEVELTDEQARRVLSLVDQEIASDVEKALALTIRANPPKPPRMAEPGWGEKVIAHTVSRGRREVWLHAGYLWRTEDNHQAAWDDLIDPEPWRADS